ncbi:hypothetical protein [Effusibacillus consociatus]|uniref:Uncharacterized protein n=1 Tax=Effusibacillus consociatus TaxID=1117041 RepID=A0ABV9Q430_9BACL
MACSLVDRCHEVKQVLQQNALEKLLCAKTFLQASVDQKLIYAIRYLETELKMHQEVRTLWPYLLAIPNRKEANLFCQMYQCELGQLGEVVQSRIDRLSNSLKVIQDKMVPAASPSLFWSMMRNQLLEKVGLEAREIITKYESAGGQVFFNY